MTDERSGVQAAVCDRPGCPDAATFRFGVEPRQGQEIAAYALGERVGGRRRFPGDTIHACAKHAAEIYDACRAEEVRQMLHVIA